MAENINLVGNFTDNITPKLKKLNREITQITKSFSKLGGKIRPVTKEMGKLAMASDRVADNLKMQRQSFNATTQALRSYTTASRKATAQQGKFNRSARPLPAPRGPGRGPTPRGGGKGGGSGLAAAGAAFGTGAIVAGQQMGQMIMQGLGQAFDMYKSLLLKPFEFIASGIGERIQDEMEDIKAAGGIYSISKRMDNPMVRTFAEAESLTKETNRYLAELAGALPGDTQQYIQVARQISDSIGLIISNDKENALMLGEKLAEQRGADTKVFEQGGQAAVQAAFKEMTGELTKQTVLAGGGGASAMGAMGLPQLSERMISTQDLSVNMFRRYSAIFRDPQIMGALERNMEKINATTKGTAERFEAIQAMYAEVVTPEYVRRVQRSTEGVIESLKTTFLNPEVGLLGLGRPIDLAAKATNDLSIKYDQFGRMLDKNNKVTTDVTQAARESLSVFEYFRDIFANVIIVLEPIIQAAAGMIDPFKELGFELDGLRNATMKFQRDFEAYRVGLEELADGMDKETRKGFVGTIPLRAALNTVNNLFANMGVYTDEEFQKLATQLKSPDFTDFATLIPKMVNDFLTSDFAIEFGRRIGEVFGTILKSFSDLLLGITDEASTGNLFAGFVEGFKGAGGVDAAKAILGKLVETIGKIFMFMVTNFPLESFVVALVALAPAIISGLVAALPQLISMAAPAIGSWISTWLLPTIGGWLGAVGPAMAGIGTFVKATLLPALGGIGTFISGTLLPALGSAASAVAAVAAPVLAVVGAVLGLIAIFRHLDFILSSFGHGLVLVAKLVEAGFLDIIGNILKLIGMIPGMGGMGEKGQEMLDQAAEARAEAGRRMDAINENTAKSLQRTAEDFQRIGNMAKGRGAVTNEEAGLTKPGDATAEQNIEAMESNLNGFTDGIAKFFTEDIPNAFKQAWDGMTAFLQQAWDGTVTFFTDTIPQAWNQAVEATKSALKQAWDGFVNFFVQDIPYAIGFAIGFAIGVVQNVWNNLVNFFTQTLPQAWSDAVSFVTTALMTAWNNLVTWVTVTLPEMISGAIDAVIAFFMSIPQRLAALAEQIKNAIVGILESIAAKFTEWIDTLIALPGQIGGALASIATSIVNWAKNLPGQVWSALTGGAQAGQQAAQQNASSSYNGNTSRTMSLGAAITKENKEKPAGSHLVIANSSEQVIPASKGYSPFGKAIPANEGYGPTAGGAGAFDLSVIGAGISAVQAEVAASGAALKMEAVAIKNGVTTTKTELAAKISEVVTAITTKSAVQQVDVVKSIPIPMSLQVGGGPMGGPAPINAAAASFGLTMTSGYRPGDEDSYHGINRARDYAGPPAQMMAFAKFMAAQFGGSLMELIYTPLGFGIKNGQVVPPYAAATHYDHVHVAYGMGAGNPAFFSSQRDAVSWENKMAPQNATIASVTTHSGEIGGNNSVNVGDINVSVSGVDDPKAIANQVAEEILYAIRKNTYTEVFNT